MILFPLLICYIHRVKRSIFIVIFIFCCFLYANAEENIRLCTQCGSKAYSKLAMSCDKCNGDLANHVKGLNKNKNASLQIEAIYMGQNPSNLYPYLKLYINDVFIDKIETLSPLHTQADGFFLDYKPKLSYKKTINNIPPGIKTITLELRFKRMGGLLKSNKKIQFEYVNLEPSKTTKLQHFFNSAMTFITHNEPKDLQKPRDYFNETPQLKMYTATGTAEIGANL